MSKPNRKQAVQAETLRRAAASGVPPELFVYELKPHYERGPRPFFPVKVTQTIGTERHDSSLWPSLLQSATRDGVPIEFAPCDHRTYRDGRTPLADLGTWGDFEHQLFVLSDRANAALEPFLRPTCRPVPLTCTSAPLHGYLLEAVDDVLDVDKTQADWAGWKTRQTCTHITEYSFHSGKLGGSHIFWIPQSQLQVLVLQPFVDAVEQHRLTGFQYKRVWPHPPMPAVITIPVRKSPPQPGLKRPDLTYSVAVQKVATDFVEPLLGSPLTPEDGDQVELIAYRLPDLSLPSGAIIADDLLLSEGKPFARKVKPGTYPLTLLAARSTAGEEWIAFAIVQFADAPVATWEVAAIDQPGNKKSPSSDEGYYGAGTGGLCDAAAQEVLQNSADSPDALAKRLAKEMKKSYRLGPGWLHVQTPAGAAAIFTSGYGDGMYQSYFGLDQAGQPVALLTDFGVLNWPRQPD